MDTTTQINITTRNPAGEASPLVLVRRLSSLRRSAQIWKTIEIVTITFLSSFLCVFLSAIAATSFVDVPWLASIFLLIGVGIIVWGTYTFAKFLLHPPNLVEIARHLHGIDASTHAEVIAAAMLADSSDQNAGTQQVLQWAGHRLANVSLETQIARRRPLVLLIVALVIAIAFVLSWRLPIHVARFLRAPFEQTYAAIVPQPPQLAVTGLPEVVFPGQTLQFEVHALDGSNLPTSAITMKADGFNGSIERIQNSQHAAFRLTNIQSDLTLQALGPNNLRSAPYDLTLVEPINIQRHRFTITPPPTSDRVAYTSTQASIQVLQDDHVSLEIEVDHPVADMDLVFVPSDANMPNAKVPATFVSRNDTGTTHQFSVENLGKPDQEHVFTAAISVIDDAQQHYALPNKLLLQIVSDKPPTISFKDDELILAGEELRVEGTISDDFGIGSASLTLHRTDNSPSETQPQFFSLNVPVNSLRHEFEQILAADVLSSFMADRDDMIVFAEAIDNADHYIRSQPLRIRRFTPELAAQQQIDALNQIKQQLTDSQATQKRAVQNGGKLADDSNNQSRRAVLDDLQSDAAEVQNKLFDRDDSATKLLEAMVQRKSLQDSELLNRLGNQTRSRLDQVNDAIRHEETSRIADAEQALLDELTANISELEKYIEASTNALNDLNLIAQQDQLIQDTSAAIRQRFLPRSTAQQLSVEQQAIGVVLERRLQRSGALSQQLGNATTELINQSAQDLNGSQFAASLDKQQIIKQQLKTILDADTSSNPASTIPLKSESALTKKNTDEWLTRQKKAYELLQRAYQNRDSNLILEASDIERMLASDIATFLDRSDDTLPYFWTLDQTQQLIAKVYARVAREFLDAETLQDAKQAIIYLSAIEQSNAADRNADDTPPANDKEQGREADSQMTASIFQELKIIRNIQSQLLDETMSAVESNSATLASLPIQQTALANRLKQLADQLLQGDK